MGALQPFFGLNLTVFAKAESDSISFQELTIENVTMEDRCFNHSTAVRFGGLFIEDERYGAVEQPSRPAVESAGVVQQG